MYPAIVSSFFTFRRAYRARYPSQILKPLIVNPYNTVLVNTILFTYQETPDPPLSGIMQIVGDSPRASRAHT